MCIRSTIRINLFALLALVSPTALYAADAVTGVTPVTTGVVIRGLEMKPPYGAPGTPAATSCDFSKEDVDGNGNMEDASVNCRPGGNLANTIVGLPDRFKAYCVINAPVKSARLIQSPIKGKNDNHCSLSGITIKDATGQFGGAVWR